MVAIDLSGRTALITGGAAGLGNACARLLAEAGARVALVDIDEPGAVRAARDIGGFGVGCDVSDHGSVKDAVAAVEAELGPTDMLIHAAGLISYESGVTAIGPEEWDRVLDVNLRGAYLLCHELAGGMKERGFGRIIEFTSLAARVGGIEVGIHYTTSKAGLWGLVRTLAKECGPFGVTVNAVAPGFIGTGPVRKALAGREEQVAATIPLRRLGEPDDVAGTVLFLCSDLAGYITGATIDINGGLYMS